MAKQLVNPVERHAEKAVLAVAILLLIGVVVRYLATSPNQLEVGGNWVSPKTVDQQLARKAATARDRIRRAQSPEEMPEPLIEVFEEELDPFDKEDVPLTLSTVVAVGPEVPIIDQPGRRPGDAELVEPGPTGPPAVSYGRSTYKFVDENREEQRREANWVTISALFDVKALMAQQRSLYGETRKEVIFGTTQLQRRACHDDGSWSDDDWESIEPYSWPPLDLPSLPNISIVKDDDKIVVSDEDQGDVERFFERLSDPERQLELLRPQLPEIINGTRWTFPEITTFRDVLDQDDYYLHRNQPPSADPDNRYEREEEEAGAVPRIINKAEQIARDLEEADRLLKRASDQCSENDAMTAYNIAFEISRDREAGPGDKSRAARLMEQADQVAADVRRRHARGECARRPVIGEESEEEFKREPLPVQQIWVHDAEPGSIESGKTYQYRLRPQIYNRLAGEPDKFRNPADAAVVFIPGKWSEPVEVSIEPDMLFFATNKNQRQQEVTVEFFRWFEGVWVRARDKFRVGDGLQVKRRVWVPPWEDGSAPENTLVEFATDSSVLDIDFDRDHRERKRGKTRSGVKFNPASESCCAVFVDSEGRLQERFVAVDKGHPHKRGIRVYSPPRKD